MSKNLGTFLRVLIAFSVALTLNSARAQTEPSSQNPAGSQQDTSATCASGDISACQNTQSTQGSSGETGTSQWGFPAINAGTPNAPMSVYRDDADSIDRKNESRQHPTTAPPKPRSLTEFQMLVAGSIGRIVPVYGADLFVNVPDTFAPVQRLPVTPEYVIGPGDELLIRTWGQVSQNLHLTVDRSGSVYVPQVGEFRVAGLQFRQLQGFLKARFDRVYRNYDLNVNLGQLRSIQVFVTGEARRPGSYTISSLSTLVNAVFACGGPGPQGSLRHIRLSRNGALAADFDLYDLLLRGDKSKDVNLETGDVIYFPAVGPEVAVVGSVRAPAIYELRGQESIAAAIALAGGASSVANTSSLEIERNEKQADGSSSRVAVDVEMNEQSLATPMHNADIVRVRADAPRFAKTVTLRGNVATPGRFAWHEGMHISDLIPNKESLLTPNYWLRREQLGLPVTDFQPMLPPEKVQAVPPQPGQTFYRPVAPEDSQTINSGLFPGLTAGVPEDTTASQQASSGQFQSLAASSDEDELARGARKAAQTPNQLETLGSGPHLVTAPHFQIETQVVRTSPDIDWSYAVVERVDKKTLTTRLIPFNLGALVIEHDAKSDVTLEQGDVITVFSDADIRVPRAHQTKYVRLEGEFEHAGVYSVLPGETLRQLVMRAGGLTSQAYLYGSQFSRESTRREQQQRLDEYVSALSYQIEISASNKASSVVSPQEAATVGASVASQRELVNRLREVRATGRIVLHIEPFRSEMTSLPDLPLEDGDRFVVPPIPSTVGIVGAVYDPNSFVYIAHRHAGEYLRNAGGPNRNADRKQIFIIRADGSVVSRQYLDHNLWTDDKFNREVIYPGDTIVVPEQLNKTTLLRGLTDWSAVFSQFALGAAAINVIR
ncbi:MAG TPA: SLBB domain-containing protein [Terracidiphilus sp.]|jgi:protein involved in polysaccharide export with SLBB domain